MRPCGFSTRCTATSRSTNDRTTLKLLLPTLVDIVEHHLAGTKFNIHVDPEDGLLVQGEEGYQLTWMDAKMGDWVVTPRRGKAVEINALWYNALRLARRMAARTGDEDGRDATKSMRNARALRSTSASGLPTAVIFTTWSIATAKRAPTTLLPAEPDLCDLARSSRSG